MWQIILGIGFIFLILEMFTPTMFFLNFSISAFICAILSLYIKNVYFLIVVFSILSVVLIFTLRPLLVRKTQNKNLETGINAKYIGKTAKVIEKIDSNSGAITIYDERWQAKSKNNETFEVNEIVKIVSFEGIVAYVEKV